MAQKFSGFLVEKKKKRKKKVDRAPELGILSLTMQEAFTGFCGLLGGTRGSEACL